MPFIAFGRVVSRLRTLSGFFHRGTNRGEQFQPEYQKMYDDGIQIALKYFGE